MVKPLLLLFATLLTACEPGLERQPKVKDDEEASFFQNHSGARAALNGTVTYLAPNSAKPKLSRALLERGQQRFEIYCSVCHGLTGDADGLAVQRGFPKPETFHEAKNRKLTTEAIREIAAHGQEAMLGFANRLSPDDLWAVSYYVQALQLRAHFPKKLMAGGKPK